LVFNSARLSPAPAFNKDALPNSPWTLVAGSSHSACQNKHRFLAWFFQAQYQAFVRSAVGSGAALKPSRFNGPAFWNLSLGAGSRFENSGLSPVASTGPATLDRCR